MGSDGCFSPKKDLRPQPTEVRPELTWSELADQPSLVCDMVGEDRTCSRSSWLSDKRRSVAMGAIRRRLESGSDARSRS